MPATATDLFDSLNDLCKKVNEIICDAWDDAREERKLLLNPKGQLNAKGCDLGPEISVQLSPNFKRFVIVPARATEFAGKLDKTDPEFVLQIPYRQKPAGFPSAQAFGNGSGTTIFAGGDCSIGCPEDPPVFSELDNFNWIGAESECICNKND